MAEDVIIHGDFVQFNGNARCKACQAKDLKCALQQSDNGCMACAGANGECIFSRVIPVSGPKSRFDWDTLLHRDRRQQVMLQTPTPSVAVLPSPATETSFQGVGINGASQGHSPARPSHIHSAKRHRLSLPKKNPILLQQLNHNNFSPSVTESPHLRTGIDPVGRQPLSHIEISSLEEQAQQRQLAMNNARIEQWRVEADIQPLSPEASELSRGSNPDFDDAPESRTVEASEVVDADSRVYPLQGVDEAGQHRVQIHSATQAQSNGLSLQIRRATLEAYPWRDGPRIKSANGTISQPDTANAAMMQFMELAARNAPASGSETCGDDDESGFMSQDDPPIVPRLRAKPSPDKPLHTARVPNEIDNKPIGNKTPLKSRATASPRQIRSAIPPQSTRSELLFSQIPVMNSAATANTTSAVKPPQEPQGTFRTILQQKDDKDVNSAPKSEKQDLMPSPEIDGADPYDMFEAEIHAQNPRLPSFLLKRLAQEQSRRYKRLISFKVDHLKSVQRDACPSGALCLKGKEYDGRPEKTGTMGFKPSRSEQGEQSGEASELSADLRWLPSEYPMPPTQTLPSEFECPLCFRVKKFSKPSDWAKHKHTVVCEDLQPFTCTFEGCPDAKSFKRKADWIRHENERHRQLEWWKCNMIDCTHMCFRKDNFVQHLVREHKLPEPKPRISHFRSPNEENLEKEDPVWRRVEDCRNETSKGPRDEPCKFCGNVCSSWKKLSSHLAKHMEDIAFPIWKKVLQKEVTSDTMRTPPSAINPPLAAAKTPAYTPWYPIQPATSDRTSSMSEWDRSSLNSRRSTLNSVTQSNYHPLQPIPRISSIASTTSHFTTVNKPYLCDVPGCSHERGFATQTDLKRHQRGVHAIYEDGGGNDTTYYRCQGKDCKDAGKTWPRRDNFRGHLARKHPEEEIEELTERSTFRTPSTSISKSSDPNTTNNNPSNPTQPTTQPHTKTLPPISTPLAPNTSTTTGTEDPPPQQQDEGEEPQRSKSAMAITLLEAADPDAVRGDRGEAKIEEGEKSGVEDRDGRDIMKDYGPEEGAAEADEPVKSASNPEESRDRADKADNLGERATKAMAAVEEAQTTARGAETTDE